MMSRILTRFLDRWRDRLPVHEQAGADRFLERHPAELEDLEERLRALLPTSERALVSALTFAPQYGAVIKCGDMTLGAHPDLTKNQAGEVALIDWARPGGEVIAEGARAGLILFETCGAVRTLGALGVALLKTSRPLQEWLAQFADLAREARALEDSPGAPEDENLRIGLGMRAIALTRMGAPGDQPGRGSSRTGDVLHTDPQAFGHASDTAGLKVSERDRLFLPTPRRGDDGSFPLDVSKVPARLTDFQRLLFAYGWQARDIEIRENGYINIELERADRRWIHLRRDAHGRAVVETWQREMEAIRPPGGPMVAAPRDYFMSRFKPGDLKDGLLLVAEYVAHNPAPHITEPPVAAVLDKAMLAIAGSHVAERPGTLPSYEPFGVGKPQPYGKPVVKDCAAFGVGGPCWGKVQWYDRRDPLKGRVAKPLCKGHLGATYKRSTDPRDADADANHEREER